VDQNKPRYATGDWVYIYTISTNDDKSVLYERSMPRDCMRQVDDRIKVLRDRGQEAFYTIGATFPGAFY